MTKIFNPKVFLTLAGLVFLLLGILGFIGLLGPVKEKSVFNATWYLDSAESSVYITLGIICLIAILLLPKVAQRGLTLIIAAGSFFFGVYSLFTSQVGPAMLQSPADTALLLIIGTWALWSGMNEFRNN
jgi:hypothetical protein